MAPGGTAATGEIQAGEVADTMTMVFIMCKKHAGNEGLDDEPFDNVMIERFNGRKTR